GCRRSRRRKRPGRLRKAAKRSGASDRDADETWRKNSGTRSFRPKAALARALLGSCASRAAAGLIGLGLPCPAGSCDAATAASQAPASPRRRLLFLSLLRADLSRPRLDWGAVSLRGRGCAVTAPGARNEPQAAGVRCMRSQHLHRREIHESRIQSCARCERRAASVRAACAQVHACSHLKRSDTSHYAHFGSCDCARNTRSREGRYHSTPFIRFAAPARHIRTRVRAVIQGGCGTVLAQGPMPEFPPPML